MENENFRSQPKQQRGRQRVDAILNAASEVFAEVGYDAATTIQIAARAKTSVGSLYQFFANKEAILRALVERYVAAAGAMFSNVQVESFPQMTLAQSVKAMLVPLKEFIRDNRDFHVIFSSSTGSAFLTEAIREMDEGLLARTDFALAQSRPNISSTDRRKYGLVCMVIMKGLLGLAHYSSELSLDEIFEEMEAVYVRYLTPVVGE
jgi:AcrR family transcriptional regulator